MEKTQLFLAWAGFFPCVWTKNVVKCLKMDDYAVTKEFIYSGNELYANIATSARGSVYFTLISGDERYESCETFGNSVDKRIRFDDDETVKNLSGKPVRLEIRLYDADLYSINFR